MDKFVKRIDSPKDDDAQAQSDVRASSSTTGSDIHNCRGQCYDGASNVSGHINGLQQKIRNVEPRAIYVHCLAHNLNLVAQDAMRVTPQVRDFLVTMRELIILVTKSPKRLAWFERLQRDAVITENEHPKENLKKLKPFRPTRWCVRIKSLKTIIENYEVLLQFLQELSLDSKNEIGASASGHLKKFYEFESCFLLRTLIMILEKIEILNAALQNSKLNFHDAQANIDVMLSHLKNIRNDSEYDQLWREVEADARKLNLDEAKLTRQRKAPRKYDSGSEPHQFDNTQIYYRKIHFEILDSVIIGIERRFNKEINNHLAEMESFALGGENQKVVEMYKADFIIDRLVLHRNMFLDVMKENNFENEHNYADVEEQLEDISSSYCENDDSIIIENSEKENQESITVEENKKEENKQKKRNEEKKDNGNPEIRKFSKCL
ncbi:unnamed protein product [Phaedon cochleariae]|uniref:Zinc finger MYM-type protein 1-like n=1 Tax=Phaedon cochleariae TaxID=80249 RepID=A0A9N9SF02_PHACE|nr:unnamed protein product [Phaedon cochleariae]